MAPYLHVYPDSLLDQLKKKQKLKDELKAEIERVLTTDPDVQRLIRDRTSDKFQELVDRSR
jgi:hypothetical protein